MEKQDITTGFKNVDNSQTEFLKKFLEDVSKMPDILESFKLQLKWMDIQEGNRVLDIGCGIGVQAVEMAKQVGATGKVTGTDLSAVMVEIAKNSFGDSGLPLEFLVADALHQPFPDETFDSVRTERVLMYIKDTDAAFTEFKRLLKPKGRLVIFDVDWDALVIAHANKPLTRKIVRYVSDSFPNGRIGGDLFHYFKKYDFKNIKVKPVSYTGPFFGLTKRVCEGVLQTGISNNVFTQSEVSDWWEALENDSKAGKFFASYAGFIVAGTK